eukprot:5573958-Amphidinium_carterae.1
MHDPVAAPHVAAPAVAAPKPKALGKAKAQPKAKAKAMAKRQLRPAAAPNGLGFKSANYRVMWYRVDNSIAIRALHGAKRQLGSCR